MEQTATAVIIDFFNNRMSRKEQKTAYQHLVDKTELDTTGAANILEFMSLLSGADEGTTERVMSALSAWYAGGQLRLIDFYNPTNVKKELTDLAKNLFESSVMFMSYVAGTEDDKEQKTWPTVHRDLLQMCNELSKINSTLNAVLTDVEEKLQTNVE